MEEGAQCPHGHSHAQSPCPMWQAAVWIAEDSCPEYMLKAEECLRQEEERVQHYLHISTKPKLLEQVSSLATCAPGEPTRCYLHMSLKPKLLHEHKFLR